MTEMQIQYRNLQEARRHNQKSEDLANLAHEETVRANKAREAETHRYNVETLAETQRANQAKEALQRQANIINASNYRAVLEETQRSNLAREAENQRANLAKEAENQRANVARETETHRANIITESQKEQELTSKITLNAAQVAQTNANTKGIMANTRLTQSKAKSQEISNVYAPAEKSVNIVGRFIDMIKTGVDAIGRSIAIVK